MILKCDGTTKSNGHAKIRWSVTPKSDCPHAVAKVRWFLFDLKQKYCFCYAYGSSVCVTLVFYILAYSKKKKHLKNELKIKKKNSESSTARSR